MPQKKTRAKIPTSISTVRIQKESFEINFINKTIIKNIELFPLRSKSQDCFRLQQHSTSSGILTGNKS